MHKAIIMELVQRRKATTFTKKTTIKKVHKTKPIELRRRV